MNELLEEKKKNKDTIQELAASISVWMQTNPDNTKAQRIADLHDFVAYRMLELEVQGQREKIEQMNEVLKLLKA